MLDEFRGWTYEDAERALDLDPVRGWPVRKIMLMREFARAKEQLDASRSSDHVDPPKGPMAERVVRIEQRRHREDLRAHAERKRAEAERLAGGGEGGG